MKSTASNAIYDRASVLIPAFYVSALAFSFDWVAAKNSANEIVVETALWPVRLVGTFVSMNTFFLLLSVLLPGSLLLAALFWRSFSVRVFAFMTLLLLGAALNSKGKINHGLHPYILISFVLAVLSTNRWLGSSRDDKLTIGAMLLGAQSILLFVYSICGFWKLTFGLRALLRGAPNFLNPDGLALVIADRVLQTGHSGILSNFFVSHLLPGPFVLTTGLLLELSALGWLFASRWIPLLGVLLFGLHFGVLLMLGISFKAWIPIIGLWLVAPGVLSVPVAAFFRRGRWRRYRSLRPLRVTMLVLAVHASLSIACAVVPRTSMFAGEVFPISSWVLFVHTPSAVRSEFACLVESDTGEQSLVEQKGPLKSTEAHATIDRLGRALESGDIEAIRLYTTQLERLHLKPGDRYRIVKRRFNILERYRGGGFLSATELGRFTVEPVG